MKAPCSHAPQLALVAADMVDSVSHMSPYTLAQAAKALRVPQHRLIHLCEKEVVLPDIADARGRGTSRRFSRRNLFEFAVALEMRRLELPVSFIQAVLRVLRTFEQEVRSSLKNFTLPGSLLTEQGPRLALLILDGEQLYFTLTHPKRPPIIFGGIAVRHKPTRGRARGHQGIGRLRRTEACRAFESARTRTEVDLSQIAEDLEEELPSPG